MSNAICTTTGLSIPECSCRQCHLMLLARHGAPSPGADRLPISTSTPPCGSSDPSGGGAAAIGSASSPLRPRPGVGVLISVSPAAHRALIGSQ
jgi:hypothetical protein